MRTWPSQKRQTVDPTTEYMLLLDGIPEHFTWESLSKVYEHQFAQFAPQWLPRFNGLKLFDTWKSSDDVNDSKEFTGGAFRKWMLLEEK